MGRLLPVFIFLSLSVNVFAAKTEIEGTVEVMVVDNLDGTSEVSASLIEAKSHKRIRIKPKHQDLLKGYVTGQKLKIKGVLQAEEITMDGAEAVSVEALETETGAGNEVEKRILSVIVDFQDAVSSMASADLPGILTGTAQHFKEVTFGKIVINNDADADGAPDIHRVQIPNLVATPGCTSSTYIDWRDNVIEILRQRGVSLTPYTNLVMYLPESVNCTWAGVGYVGSLRSSNVMYSWVKKESTPSPRVTVHELGHNIGMRHAGKDVDNNGIAENEYSDSSCFMSSYLRGANGPHLIELGAFEDHDHSVKEMTAREETFNIAATDVLPSSTLFPQVIKVIKKVTSATQTSHFFLSYKRGTQVADRNLLSAYKVGVSIHSQTQKGAETLYIDTLAPGEEFVDAAGVAVKMISKSADGSAVRVWARQLDPLCVLAAPTITTTPVELFMNSSATASVTIKNNNSASCRTGVFDLRVTSNPAVAASVVEKIAIAPGQSAATSVELAAAGTVGTFDLSVTAVEGIDGSLSRSQALPVSVKSIYPEPATELTSSVGTSGLTLSWTASVSSSVVSYKVFRRLYGSTSFVLQATVAGTSYSQALPTKQATYYVRAVNASNYSSAPSSTVVYTPDSTILAPTGLSNTTTSSDLTLSWQASSSSVGVSEYKVFRRAFNEEAFAEVGTTKTLSFTQPLPTTKVFYRVKAQDVYGKVSEFSVDSVYTPASTIGAPTGVSSSVSAPNLRISWNAAPASVGVARYLVLRRNFNASTFTQIGTTAELAFSEALPTVKAHYRIRAQDVYGKISEDSLETVYTPDSTVQAPTNLASTVASPNVSVSWAAAASSVGVEQYLIFRRKYTETTFTQAGTSRSLNFTETLPTVKVFYTVKAQDLYGKVSDASAEVAYTPASTVSAPTGVSTSVASPNLTVKWSAATSSVGVEKYLVFRRGYTEDTYVQAGETSTLSFTQPLPSVRSYFKVKAQDVYGKASAYSNYVTYTPPSTLTAPTNLTIRVTKSSLALTWTAATSTVSVESYKVYRKLSGASSYTLVGTVSTPSYTEALPTRSATYYVVATDAYGYTKTSATKTYVK